MRPYAGLNPGSHTDPKVRQDFTVVDFSFRELYAAIGKLAAGNTPVASSGSSSGGTGGLGGDHHKLINLTTFDDHSQYLYLAGRTSGQTITGIDTTTPILKLRGFDKTTAPTSTLFRATNSDGTSVCDITNQGQIKLVDPVVHGSGNTIMVDMATQTFGNGSYVLRISQNTSLGISPSCGLNYNGSFISFSNNVASIGVAGSGVTYGQYVTGGSTGGPIFDTSIHGPLAFDMTAINNHVTTRVATWRDLSGTVAFLSDITTQTSTLLDGVVHTDTAASTCHRGDIIAGNSSAKWAGVLRGAANTFVSSDGTDTKFQTLDAAAGSPTVTGNWTFQGNITVSNSLSPPVVTIQSDNTGGLYTGTGLLLLDTTGSNFHLQLAPSATLTADAVVLLPATGGSLITNSNTISLSNKTLDSTTNINCGLNSSSGAKFRQNTSTSKYVQFDMSLLGGSVSHRFLDTQGTIPLVGNNDAAATTRVLGRVNSTGQTADIASTKLTNGHPAGMYRVMVVLEDTTADATAGAVTCTISWTDDVGATTGTVTQLLTGTGRSVLDQVMYLASGDITYATTHTGIYGTSQYALRIRIMSLG